MIHAARDAGTTLKEGYEVTDDVTFDKESGLWTVPSSQVPDLCSLARQFALAGCPICQHVTIFAARAMIWPC